MGTHHFGCQLSGLSLAWETGYFGSGFVLCCGRTQQESLFPDILNDCQNEHSGVLQKLSPPEILCSWICDKIIVLVGIVPRLWPLERPPEKSRLWKAKFYCKLAIKPFSNTPSQWGRVHLRVPLFIVNLSQCIVLYELQLNIYMLLRRTANL